MRNRKGFTLMELLLVVAVLAIVAAAAAPTFFSGATEAINEAKKSSFLSAYQNTLSGANLLFSIEASKGNVLNAETFATADLDKYVPEAARKFNNGTKDVVLTASFSDADNKIVVQAGKTPVDVNADWETISKYSSVAP
ncbi:MAG: prepilin-type N-terminal cleavage/methylation domain-containing protein [Candidatus Ozemobacteraceae bacterium]